MWKRLKCKALNSWGQHLKNIIFISLGAFLAAVAVQLIFIPNNLIDGGIVGLAMIMGKLSSQDFIPYFIIMLNLPFGYLAYKHLGLSFLINLAISVILFAGFNIFLQDASGLHGQEILEIIVIGGVTMGIGIGLIIKTGSCLDGVEIMSIIINKKTGFTVGQTIFVINIFIFSLAGIVFQSWRPPFLSLMTYFVAMKVMDIVIVGLEETKSVNIISSQTKKISDAIMNELGAGLTIMYGRGGYSQEDREIIYVVVERIQLATLKKIVYREDPKAFMAVQNLHEISNGQRTISDTNNKKHKC